VTCGVGNVITVIDPREKRHLDGLINQYYRAA
jgi:hypothetical protein